MADDIERVRQAALKDPAQLVRFADLLVASGRSEEAVQACRKGLTQRADDVPLRLALGRALMAAGHLEEAQAALLDAVARQKSAGGSPARPAPKPPVGDEDSGPVIADPSIEEVIELETRVGRTAGETPASVADGPSFGDEAPTSVVGAEEMPRSPRRVAPAPASSKLPPRESVSSPADRARVTTLPARTPARSAAQPRAPEPRHPEPRHPEPVGRRSDRVTTLPERGTSDRGASERGASERAAAEVAEPEARAWAPPPSQPLELESPPPREERRATPRPRHEPAPRIEASELQARRRGTTPEPSAPARRHSEPEADRSLPSRPRMSAPPGPIDLLGTARGLLGQVAAGDEAQPVDVLVAPPVADEMTRAWDARRARSFVWLWVALVLLSGTGGASYVYRSRERARLLAIAVERADARALEATADGDFAARDAYAGALRAEPKMRKYAAMVANAASRLSTDHGEDTDAAAWAMLKRAEKEALRKPDATPDPRTERDLRQARGLLALGRGETCPTLDEKDDGEIAARCALQRGDTDAARRILGDTLKTTGDAKNARALIALASLELGAGDLDAADAAYNKILSAYPGHPRAMVGRLLVAIERGESPKIAETLPGSGRLGLTTESWFHLARGLTALNAKTTDTATREQAAAELELARRGILHDGRLALLYGRACLLEGKVAEAEQAMRIAERLNPNDADVAVLDAEVALAKGYEEKVVSALSVGAQTPRKLAVLGRAQALTGRYKEAANTLDAALVKRPGDAVSITYRAIARSHLGDPAGAQRELEKAANTLSSSTPRYGLGLLAYERRDLVRARTELEKALAGQNAEAFRARALLGRVLRDLGKTQEALAELERVAREAPALLLVHSALGRLYLDLGRDRDARTELRQVIDGGNPSMDDRVAFATALVNLGAVDQGEHAIDDAVEAGVPATRVQRLRLELQSWKGSKEALIAAKALEKERKGPAAKETALTLTTANAFRRAGDYKRASELYREALIGDALHANLGIGRIQLAQNDTPGAESSFRAALDVIGKGQTSVDDETEARIGLARALLSRKASSEAAKLLEAAVEKDDLSAEAHYQLARAYQEKNDLEKARAQAERAAALDDTYADAFALIGDLNRTGAPERAKSAYKKYLELQPDGERAKAIKKSIEKLR